MVLRLLHAGPAGEVACRPVSHRPGRSPGLHRPTYSGDAGPTIIVANDSCVSRMRRDTMDAQPNDDEVRETEAATAAKDEDVEGHSVFAAIAASGALRSRAPRDGQAAGTKADEA